MPWRGCLPNGILWGRAQAAGSERGGEERKRGKGGGTDRTGQAFRPDPMPFGLGWSALKPPSPSRAAHLPHLPPCLPATLTQGRTCRRTRHLCFAAHAALHCHLPHASFPAAWSRAGQARLETGTTLLLLVCLCLCCVRQAWRTLPFCHLHTHAHASFTTHLSRLATHCYFTAHIITSHTPSFSPLYYHLAALHLLHLLHAHARARCLYIYQALHTADTHTPTHYAFYLSFTFCRYLLFSVCVVAACTAFCLRTTFTRLQHTYLPLHDCCSFCLSIFLLPRVLALPATLVLQHL